MTEEKFAKSERYTY